MVRRASRVLTYLARLSESLYAGNLFTNTVTVTGVTQLSWWGLIGRGPQLVLPLVLRQ